MLTLTNPPLFCGVKERNSSLTSRNYSLYVGSLSRQSFAAAQDNEIQSTSKEGTRSSGLGGGRGGLAKSYCFSLFLGWGSLKSFKFAQSFFTSEDASGIPALWFEHQFETNASLPCVGELSSESRG
ncbi:hypothetical protein NL676_023708 [Syzygium grande]|nr:hypothetical protein NL676_023708 [Syzygium grande]